MTAFPPLLGALAQATQMLPSLSIVTPGKVFELLSNVNCVSVDQVLPASVL